MLFSSLRYFHARPRLLIGAAVAMMFYFLTSWIAPMLPQDMLLAKNFLAFEPVSKFLLAWNMGVWVYLLLVFYMMYHAKDKSVHQKALNEDEGTGLMILLALGTAVVAVVAIIQELGVSKGAKGGLLYFHIGLTFTTIVTAWLFIHTMFALHYGLMYYAATNKAKSAAQRHKSHIPNHSLATVPLNTSNDQRADHNPTQHTSSHDTPTSQRDKQVHPLDFPHEDEPNFWDFLYFSYIIGTSAQTADVSFSNRKTRQLGIVHCVLAFFFNTAVLALMINLASGLFGNG